MDLKRFGLILLLFCGILASTGAVSAKTIDSGEIGNWWTKTGWEAASNNDNQVWLHVKKYRALEFHTDMSITSIPNGNGCQIIVSNLNPSTPDGGYFGEWQGHSLIQKWTVILNVNSKNALQWYKDRNFGSEIANIII